MKIVFLSKKNDTLWINITALAVIRYIMKPEKFQDCITDGYDVNVCVKGRGHYLSGDTGDSQGLMIWIRVRALSVSLGS
jgi:hypothetical protein